MPDSGFQSASGLRPVAAFVLIVCVLIAVAAKSAFIAIVHEGEQPSDLHTDRDPRPSFRMLDREGRPLGMSIECFDLTISPQATWRSHTPDYMADRIAAVIGTGSGAELLPRMLDPEMLPGPTGSYRVAQPNLLLFDEATAGRVMRWIRAGIHEGERSERLEGLHLVRHSVLGKYTLEWEPRVLLSREQRTRHDPACAERPSLWTKRLLDDLGSFVDLERVEREATADMGQVPTRNQLHSLLRDRIWNELMPCQFRVVARRIDPVSARDLDRMLKQEAVSVYQMKLEACLDRRHPTRPDGLATGPVPNPDQADAFPILGAWGVLGSEDAWARAARDQGLPAGRPILDPALRRVVAEGALRYETEFRPWSGLELVCYTELRQPRWRNTLERRERSYLRAERIVPRDRSQSWRDADSGSRIEVPDYFCSAETASSPPEVVTTLDAGLQAYLHECLQETRQANAAALAMGIVIDVDTGGVLAVDSSCAYPYSGFAPIRHAFTPGSTFKVPIMASALDMGLVRPEEEFATHAGPGLLVIDPTRGTSRRIHEAEGAPREARVSAAQGLALSVNAVLVQIGLRAPAADLRAHLDGLGYGHPVHIGLGPESGGYLPELRKGTWSRLWTHASVCFGHEVSTTLWQHATALATIARGGISRPLRLIGFVEQDGQRHEAQVEPGTRVLRFEACMQVREMLALGAREGTGRAVAGPELCPEFEYIGTKTGTTEKVGSEVCVHTEFQHQAEHLERQQRDPSAPACDRECRGSLVGVRAHDRKSCYTSSMLSIGKTFGSERELLVLVVVDGPRGKAKFGREVAGQCNIDVLRRAFDLPERVEPAQAASATAALPTRAPLRYNDSDLPWIDERKAEEAHHVPR